MMMMKFVGRMGCLYSPLDSAKGLTEGAITLLFLHAEGSMPNSVLVMSPNLATKMMSPILET